MRKFTGYVTLKIEMFAEDEEDWGDTLVSTFSLQLPHLVKNQIVSTEIVNHSDIPTHN